MEQDILAEPDKEQSISILAFSKSLGCSHTAIQNAIRDNKIVAGVHKRDGKPDKIWPSIALEEWKKSVSIKQLEQNPTLVEAITSGRGGGSRKQRSEGEQGEVDRISEYEAREKYARARTAELNLEVLEGTLVSVADVHKAQAAVGVEIRTMFESLADRNIDNIRAASTRNAAVLLLESAINEVLTRIADLGYSDELPPEI
jgi:hypothetical protein